MPIEVGIWNVKGKSAVKVPFTTIESEKRLEDILSESIDILSEDLLLLGRQVLTSFGKYIDILAIDATGKITVIELKRGRTPREVVAQALDYGSWVQDLSYGDVKKICENYHSDESFETVFSGKLTIEVLTPESSLLRFSNTQIQELQCIEGIKNDII